MFKDSRKNRELTLLVLIATIFGILDGIIPKPVPFMKLGLANIVSVITIVRFGLLRTIELNLLRVFAVALVTGMLTTPTFLLSLAGALFSALAMGLVYKLKPSVFSVVGLSVIGAVSSLWIQLLVAGYILDGLALNNFVLFVTGWAVFSGCLVGISATQIMQKKLITRVLLIGAL